MHYPIMIYLIIMLIITQLTDVSWIGFRKQFAKDYYYLLCWPSSSTLHSPVWASWTLCASSADGQPFYPPHVAACLSEVPSPHTLHRWTHTELPPRDSHEQGGPEGWIDPVKTGPHKYWGTVVATLDMTSDVCCITLRMWRKREAACKRNWLMSCVLGQWHSWADKMGTVPVAEGNAASCECWAIWQR